MTTIAQTTRAAKSRTTTKKPEPSPIAVASAAILHAATLLEAHPALALLLRTLAALLVRPGVAESVASVRTFENIADQLEAHGRDESAEGDGALADRWAIAEDLERLGNDVERMRPSGDPACRAAHATLGPVLELVRHALTERDPKAAEGYRARLARIVDAPAPAAARRGDLDLAELDIGEAPVDLKKATIWQLLHLALAAGYDDPTYWGLRGVADMIATLATALRGNDDQAAESANALECRVLVLAELHRRQRGALLARLESARAVPGEG